MLFSFLCCGISIIVFGVRFCSANCYTGTFECSASPTYTNSVLATQSGSFGRGRTSWSMFAQAPACSSPARTSYASSTKRSSSSPESHHEQQQPRQQLQQQQQQRQHPAATAAAAAISAQPATKFDSNSKGKSSRDSHQTLNRNWSC